MRNVIAVLFSCFLGIASRQLYADEGMWTFDRLPTETLKSKYGFEPDQAWIDHVMRSSVRFSSGGSGSFISSTGLVLTNHHVASDTIYKLSTTEKNLMATGYIAHSQSDELKAPDLEIDQLRAVKDVTERVNAAVNEQMSAEESAAARRTVIAAIEQEAHQDSGLKSEVVTLYQGGKYHLYQYKTYTDVRLVFAPESDIAFFGGDPDNFEYPRYDLDMTIVRVYENDKPAQIEDFLPWNAAGAGEGELIFVSGNPGRTSRLFTVAALEFQRDHRVPFALETLQRFENYLKLYAERGEEEGRIAKDELFGVQNSRKVYLGRSQGLYLKDFFENKQRGELQLRAIVSQDAKLASLQGAWDEVAVAQRAHEKIYKDRHYLEGGRAFGSDVFAFARHIVRMAYEDAKPNGQRLAEYRDSGRTSLLGQVLSEAPLYPEFEQYKLQVLLSLFVEEYGVKHKFVKLVLQGKDPASRAAELIAGTSLFDVSTRKLLVDGSPESRIKMLSQSYDSMIQLALLVDPESRRIRKYYEENVVEVERQAYAKIAKAVFQVRGTSVYPDATFSPRLAFGTVKGYTSAGRDIPAWTTLGGAFEHQENHKAQAPWKLPKSWMDAKDRMDLSTPFNFVSTADIIGGNSGSPVINQGGELVGLIFDGNIDSLMADFAYSEKTSRAVSVHVSGMLEALRKIYGATELVTELGH